MLCFFGLFELVSLFENLGEIGVPLPSFVMKSLERLKVDVRGGGIRMYVVKQNLVANRKLRDKMSIRDDSRMDRGA